MAGEPEPELAGAGPGASQFGLPTSPARFFPYSISKSQLYFQVLCSRGSDHPGAAQFLLILKVRVFLAHFLSFLNQSLKGEGKSRMGRISGPPEEHILICCKFGFPLVTLRTVMSEV